MGLDYEIKGERIPYGGKQTEELEQRYNTANVKLQAVNREVTEIEEKKVEIEKEMEKSYAQYEFCEEVRLA